jgi:hypothetical protein
MDIRLQVMLDDLAWWSAALERARAAGELTPGSLRARAALAAAQAWQQIATAAPRVRQVPAEDRPPHHPPDPAIRPGGRLIQLRT